MISPRKPKVAFISLPETFFADGGVKSGSVIVNQEIADFLKNHGCEVLLFTVENKERIELRKLKGFGNTLMFQDLYNKVDEINGCDLVITSNYYGLVIPEIKVPIVTIFHHSAKSISNLIDKNLTSKIFLNWMKRARNFSIALSTSESLHGKIMSILEQYEIDNSFKTVAVSKQFSEELVNNYNIDRRKLIVIHNAVTDDLPEEISKDWQGELEVVYVGRVAKSYGGFAVKGFDRLLEIMEKLPKFRKKIIISTDGQELYQRFFEKHLPDTEIIYNLEHEKVGSELRKSHISLHCSRVESFGLTLVESMQNANVPIAFDAGIASEIIQNGKNGFLVKNEKEAIDIIKSISRPDFRPELKKMALRARTSIKKKLSVEATYGAYLRLVKEAAENGHKKRENCS